MKKSTKILPSRPVQDASSIQVEEQSRPHLADDSNLPEKRICSLAEKIEELVVKEGYSNAQTLSVIVQLLTNGKVSIGFREYTQRLQLVTMPYTISRAQAAEIFDNHLQQIHISEKNSNGFTQKIQFQSPRVWLPQPRE